MDRNELLQIWLREEAQHFEGWDFSYLQERMIEDQPPWSYPERAAELMQRANSVIDLDTGGGERFLELKQHWPRRVVATESYPPNARLAHSRLAPLGVDVLMVPSSERVLYPFIFGAFDMVLNRHGAFNPAETARILSPGGTFLTKQIHGMTLHDLLAVFGAYPQWPKAAPERYVPMLEAAGLTIMTVNEWRGKMRFTDVGAIVYFLKATPWLVPGFTVQSHQDRLFGLQEQLNAGDELGFETCTYLIEAHKEH
jgi:hypothetical protein